jgi:ketosteroid isomerase-like protein
MDRPPAEVVRSTYDALNRGDIDAMLEALAPSIEYRMPMDPLRVHPVFRGHEGVRRFYDLLFRSFTGYRVALGSVHDLGRGVVVATGRFHARIPGEPDEREVRFSHFWEIDGGRAVRVSFHDAENPLELVPQGDGANEIAA